VPLIALLCSGLVSAVAAPVVSDLRVEQKIERKGATFQIAPQVGITFRLNRDADIHVRVGRHLAMAKDFQGIYIAEPFAVRDWKLGRLKAGTHTLNWDGLDAQGQPVVQRVNLSAPEIRALKDPHPRPEQLTRPVPVNLFQIEVRAGSDQTFSNFERLNGTASTDRNTLEFAGAVRDKEGRAVVADFRAWRGRRLSPDGKLVQTIPSDASGQSSDPAETYAAAVDSHDNAYFMNVNGLYKFGPAGNAVGWDSAEDYINNPYPSNVRNVLGLRLDPNAKGPKESGYGPARETAQFIGKPGFAFRWGGMAIDEHDNVYLGETAPTPRIQVFAPSGKFLKMLPLPEGQPQLIRATGTGKLWVATGHTLFLLDEQSGAVVKKIESGARRLYVGKDGRLLVLSGTQVARFGSDGEPIPFAAISPYVREPGNILDVSARDNKMPDKAVGYSDSVATLLGEEDGSFEMIESPSGSGPMSSRALHFSADGFYQPQLVTATLGEHEPGNVFLDDQPATVDLFVNNLTTLPQTITAQWTLSAFDGGTQSGSTPLLLASGAHQTVALTLPARELGQYTLALSLHQANSTLISTGAQLARIPSRPIRENRWSPFAMTWGTNFYLMGLAGVKSQRGDSASWGRKVEPVEGIFRPELPDALQYSDGNIDTYRRYARRWGDLLLNGLNYGENWLGGDDQQRLYSYDRFYGYSLGVMDKFGGKGEAFYQFWNEPNFFWHVPGPFSREHFALVNQHVWSIVKARDKNALEIADGDAGGVGMMKEFAQYGAAPFSDAVQIHYPGSTPLQFDKILVPDQPEGKIPMVRELVALRDKSFPGKPVWNTEEGWYSAPNKTPDLGAMMLPRVYLSQMAAGVDKIYWFSQTGLVAGPHDPTCLLDENSEPFPTYVSYATMTRLLEGAPYVGSADLGTGTYAHLFARPNDFVLAAWCVGEPRTVQLPIGGKVTRVDLMGRSSTLNSANGQLPLRLSTHVQYIVLPRGAWTLGIAHAELGRQLAALQLKSATEIPAQITLAAKTAATDTSAMNRLYYLSKAAGQAAYSGFMPPRADDAARLAASARRAVEAREGEDGYLRAARVALEWSDRAARLATQPNAPTALNWAASQAASATTSLAATETPAYPGLTIDAFLEPKKVRDNADPKQPVDERFPLEIAKKPGDAFDLELTVWNFYRHALSGTLSPRLPQGWTSATPDAAFNVEPGKFARFVFSVRVAADAKADLFSIGGKTLYRGQTVTEIHPQRVRVSAP